MSVYPAQHAPWSVCEQGYVYAMPFEGEALSAYCRRARHEAPPNRKPPLALLVKTHRLLESIANDNS